VIPKGHVTVLALEKFHCGFPSKYPLVQTGFNVDIMEKMVTRKLMAILLFFMIGITVEAEKDKTETWELSQSGLCFVDVGMVGGRETKRCMLAATEGIIRSSIALPGLSKDVPESSQKFSSLQILHPHWVQWLDLYHCCLAKPMPHPSQYR